MITWSLAPVHITPHLCVHSSIHEKVSTLACCFQVETTTALGQRHQNVIRHLWVAQPYHWECVAQLDQQSSSAEAPCVRQTQATNPKRQTGHFPH